MKTIKKLLRPVALINILLLLFCASSHAQNTYDWRPSATTGTTAWATAANWQVTNSSGVVTYPSTTYPGLTSSDIVRIGANISLAAFTKQPSIASGATYTIASLTFGNNSAAVSATGTLSLTIATGSTLTVSGTVLQMHSVSGGAANSGGRETTDCPTCYTDAINNTINGPGTLHCGYFTVGDNTLPANAYVNDNTYIYLKSALVLTVDHDFTLNSASTSSDGDQTVISRNSDANVSFQSGTMTIGGTLKETNYNPNTYVVEQYIPITSFSMDLQKNANNIILNLGGANALNIATGGFYCNNSVDFYNIATAGGTGQCYVNYTASGNQEIYNYSSFPVYALDPDPAVYQNLGFSGSGNKTFDAGVTAIGGNVSTNAGTPVVDLVTNNVALTVPGNLTTVSGSTIKQGTSDITVTGTLSNAGTLTLGSGNLYAAGSFTNSGTFTQGTGTIIFNGSGTQTLTDGGSGTTFNNVLFTGGSNKVLQSGTFLISATGVMTLSTSGTKVTTGGGNLTLVSNGSSTATIAALPSGCQLNGNNFTAQRYLDGGAGYRGYRLMSSPIYTTTDSYNNEIYSINYLQSETYISGTKGTAGGFSPGATKNNPSLYLYRENLAPAYNTFLASNFRGINDLTTAPTYGMDDTSYPTTNIPMGNAYLMFFRGGTSTASPFVTTSTPAAATLATTGTMNYGTVTVHNWYTPSSANIGFTNTPGNSAEQGLNLLGNPYPSSIDWNNYSNSNPSAAIYAPNVSSVVYLLNTGPSSSGGTWATYDASTHISVNNGTNIIPSGMGFFVVAQNASAAVTFQETAKTNSQVATLGTFLAKSIVTNPVQYLKLRLAKDSTAAEETAINFNGDTRAAYDIKEDAPYHPGTGVVSLYSLSSDNHPLVINKLPLAVKGDTIRLNVNVPASGTYSLNMVTLQNIPQLYDIWLKDAFTKDSVNLRTTPSYSFTVNASDTSTYGAYRFRLVLAQDPAQAYKLISFDAQKTGQGRQVQLTWKTANEQNYTNFTVQRSNDNGKSYEDAGSMLSSGAGSYELTDKNAQTGDNLYRLQQTDVNSVVTYSNIIDIQFANNANNIAGHLSCYPNPAVNTINLTIVPKTQANAGYDIKVTNSSGMVVKYAVVTEPNWQDNISNLITGTYLIMVTDKKDNSLVGQTKFVKL